MIKEEYKNLPDTEFVTLIEGIDTVFLGKYEISKKEDITNCSDLYEGAIVVNKNGELGVVAKGSWEKLSYDDTLQYYDKSYQDALESYKSLESKRDELIGHLGSLTGYLRSNNVSIDFILKNLEKLEISLFEFKLKLEGSVGE